MRNNNLVVRRNVRNSKQALVESIMTKIRPIVENALNEKFIDVTTKDWEGAYADGTDEQGNDGDYICWYLVNPKTNEIAFEMAKYVHGNQKWVSQEECERILGKPNGYFDYLKK